MGQARILLLLDTHRPPESTLVPSIRNGGEHIHWHLFNQGFYVKETYRQDFKCNFGFQNNHLTGRY